jgi:hypothetical protein
MRKHPASIYLALILALCGLLPGLSQARDVHMWSCTAGDQRPFSLWSKEQNHPAGVRADCAGSGIGGTGNQPESGIGGTGQQASGAIGGTGSQAKGGDGIGGTGQQAESGIGGTGAQADSGIGGTGQQADSGIGGTGQVASGIGGTGQVAGKVVQSDGVLMVRDALGHKLLLGRGDVVCTGDRINVGEDGGAVINFADGGVLYVKPGTQAKIENYHWSDSEPGKSSSTIVLHDGGVRVVSGQLAKLRPDAYQLKTDEARITVIGTDFLVSRIVKPAKDLAAGTYAKVNEGEILMENSRGSTGLVAGESAVATEGGAPARLPETPAFMGCQ